MSKLLIVDCHIEMLSYFTQLYYGIVMYSLLRTDAHGMSWMLLNCPGCSWNAQALCLVLTFLCRFYAVFMPFLCRFYAVVMPLLCLCHQGHSCLYILNIDHPRPGFLKNNLFLCCLFVLFPDPI